MDLCLESFSFSGFESLLFDSCNAIILTPWFDLPLDLDLITALTHRPLLFPDWPAWPLCWPAGCCPASRWPWAMSGMKTPAGGTGLTQTWCRLWRTWVHATLSMSHIYPFKSLSLTYVLVNSLYTDLCSFCYYACCEITPALTLTLCSTKPMWMRRTKWWAPRPSCGTQSIVWMYVWILSH